MAFNAIKVNYRNAKNKATSTTISYAVASFYALHSTDKTNLNDDEIAKIAQQAVNDIDITLFDEMQGHAKYTIESELLHKVYYDFGLDKPRR